MSWQPMELSAPSLHRPQRVEKRGSRDFLCNSLLEPQPPQRSFIILCTRGRRCVRAKQPKEAAQKRPAALPQRVLASRCSFGHVQAAVTQACFQSLLAASPAGCLVQLLHGPTCTSQDQLPEKAPLPLKSCALHSTVGYTLVAPFQELSLGIQWREWSGDSRRRSLAKILPLAQRQRGEAKSTHLVRTIFEHATRSGRRSLPSSKLSITNKFNLTHRPHLLPCKRASWSADASCRPHE